MYTSYLFGFGMQRAITHAGCKLGHIVVHVKPLVFISLDTFYIKHPCRYASTLWRLFNVSTFLSLYFFVCVYFNWLLYRI